MEVFNTLYEYFVQLGQSVDFTIFFWIFVALMLGGIFILFVLSRFSYEVKAIRSVDKLNRYFASKPHIAEENLIEFNNLMKKTPSAIRTGWQQYMLNREDSPGDYINVDTCVEKPLRTSSIDKNLKNLGIYTMALCVLSAVFACFSATAQVSIGYSIGTILLVPAIIVLIYTITTLIYLSWKNAIQSDLFLNFHNFKRNLNKAVTTLPAFIDYETLFTKKEIAKRIPILQEYIDKRAIIEQQELEKARKESAQTEKFNFDDLGINSSLLLERAMKECELYLSAKRRLQVECDQIETEKDNYKKNFDIETKEYQRKMQASRENLERLKTQQESSTNRIETNYIRKQQAEEMKKQEQLEKNNDEATTKFNEEQEVLAQEIKKRKDEIEQKRLEIENAMKSEFKTYASSIYDEIEALINNDIKEKIQKLTEENNTLRDTLNTYQSQEDVNKFIQNNEEDVKPQNTSKKIVKDEPIVDTTSQEKEDILYGDKREEKIDEPLYKEEDDIDDGMQEVHKDSAIEDDKKENDFNFNNGEDEDDDIEQENASENDFNFDDGEDVDVEVEDGFDFSDNGDEDTHNNEVEDSSGDNKAVKLNEDELVELQRMIDEENNKLVKQKLDLENEVNNKLGNMGEKTEIQQPRKKAGRPKGSTNKSKTTPTTRKPRATTRSTKNKRTTQSKSPARKTTAKTSTTTGKRGRPKKENTAVDIVKMTASKLDALASDMEKLLKKTKK